MACLRGLSCRLNKGKLKLTVYVRWYCTLGLGLGCTSTKGFGIMCECGVMWIIVVQDAEVVCECV